MPYTPHVEVVFTNFFFMGLLQAPRYYCLLAYICLAQFAIMHYIYMGPLIIPQLLSGSIFSARKYQTNLHGACIISWFISVYSNERVAYTVQGPCFTSVYSHGACRNPMVHKRVFTWGMRYVLIAFLPCKISTAFNYACGMTYTDIVKPINQVQHKNIFTNILLDIQLVFR